MGRIVGGPRSRSFFRLAVEVLEDRITPTGNLQSILGLSQLQSAFPSVNGSGETVALLDTGINYNLPSLGGGIGPGDRVIYGFNFVNNTADALDDNGHGTFLANMIGSSNPSDLGIAPDVQFADLKVLDSNMNGTWTAVENALAWVIANKTKYNIVAVNMSLGSGNYTSDSYSTALESDLATLKNMGVFIAVASGNNYASSGDVPGLAYPAVDPDVVSVGAAWAGSYGAQTFNGVTDNSTALNQFADFTQRDANLDILAPGAWITTLGMSGSETTMGGTSMATAVITGSAVLIHQALDQAGESTLATEQDILQIMKSTGTAVKDNATSAITNVPTTGDTFEEIDLPAAVAAAEPASPLSLAAIPDQTMQVGQTISVPLAISHAASDPVSFSTQLVYLPALAYQLKQQFGLTSSGNYYTNYDGFNEKWLNGSNGGWYWLMPDGALYHYTGASSTIQAANLLATLNASYYANPTLLWNAAAASSPPAVLSVSGTTLSIRSSAYWLGSYSVVVTATAAAHHSVTASFNVTVNPAPPVWTPIANQTVEHANSTLNLALNATAADGGPVSYAAQVLSASGGSISSVTLSLSGNHLCLSTPSSFVGSYTVQVSASDLAAVSTETFTVTVTDTAPTLAAIATQTMASGKASMAVSLSAADADHDALTFQAAAETPSATLYQLEQQYGFQESGGSYYQNLWGQNEKWLVGKNDVWYMLLPTGQLYRWAQSVAATLQPANLIATLSPSVYAQPELLWNAHPPATPALSFSFAGNQLTIKRPAGLTGVFFIDVTVNDGAMTAVQTFEIVLN